MLRPFFKTVCFVPVLFSYLFFAALAALLPAGVRMRHLLLARNTSFHARAVLALLGVHVRVIHPGRLRTGGRGALIVSNHVSYIDILVISSLVPSVFITSVELGGTLFLGMLARLAGSIFVERRSPSRLRKEISGIVRMLQADLSVTLFPEGTTSNGEHVHLFKKSLFDAALRSGREVLPICLRYISINDQKVSRANRDSVFYYGGTTFFQHVPRLLAVRTIQVDVMPLKSIPANKHASRKELAAEAHRAVCEAYRADFLTRQVEKP